MATDTYTSTKFATIYTSDTDVVTKYLRKQPNIMGIRQGQNTLSPRFLIFYNFHKISPLILHRLMRLKKLNPESLIVPCFGIRQQIYFPLLFRPRHTPDKFFNWFFLKSRKITEYSKKINTVIEAKRRQEELHSLCTFLDKKGLRLYCDFTPMGYYNMDLSVLNWYSSEGKNLDFDFLVYYEYDVFTSKSINKLYEKYTEHDAGFVSFHKAQPGWYWNRTPFGGKDSVPKWLIALGKDTTLYRGLFACHFVSRKVLSKFESMNMPQGYCELRWPTIITNFGFSCTPLDFPMVKFRPRLSKQEVENNLEKGIFHPVFENINE
ncbi:MAG: hypothetical protein CW691_00795 [Candidatus Bathyarchaeum sp.]|nr:MAG: hypothetical protein CW691_00795 [Candidatus Bathyarchaeum sp.]